jgi:hypothetical protein
MTDDVIGWIASGAVLGMMLLMWAYWVWSMRDADEPTEPPRRKTAPAPHPAYTLSCAYCGYIWPVLDPASETLKCPNPACGRTHQGIRYPDPWGRPYR